MDVHFLGDIQSPEKGFRVSVCGHALRSSLRAHEDYGCVFDVHVAHVVNGAHDAACRQPAVLFDLSHCLMCDFHKYVLFSALLCSPTITKKKKMN